MVQQLVIALARSLVSLGPATSPAYFLDEVLLAELVWWVMQTVSELELICASTIFCQDHLQSNSRPFTQEPPQVETLRLAALFLTLPWMQKEKYP